MRKLGDDADGGTRYGPTNGSAGMDWKRLPRRPRKRSPQAKRPPEPKRAATPAAAGAAVDLPATLERLRSQLTDERLAELASATGLPGEAWAKLRPEACW